MVDELKCEYAAEGYYKTGAVHPKGGADRFGVAEQSLNEIVVRLRQVRSRTPPLGKKGNT
jgi:hypothetical protein